MSSIDGITPYNNKLQIINKAYRKKMKRKRKLDERSIFYNMAEIAFTTDTDLVIRSINDPLIKAMGYSREGVVGKMTCADLCKTPICGTDECTIKKCFKTMSTVVGATVAENRRGEKKPIKASCGVLTDERGKVVGGCLS